MKKFIVFFIIMQGLHITVKAQDQHTVDSLLTIIKTAPDDTNKVKMLLEVGYEYEKQQPQKAIDYYKQALSISGIINNALSMADCYDYLGLYYHYSDVKYDTAKFYFEECIRIRKEVLGENHSDYAASLNNLAQFYVTTGNYTSAEPLYQEARKICKEVMGENLPLYAAILNNIGELYKLMGNYKAALPLFIEAMKVRKSVFGDKHLDYLNTLNHFALLYHLMGNYSLAEPMYLEALSTSKEIQGEKNIDYAIYLNNLSQLYLEMGNYNKAEIFLNEAIIISKEIHKDNHPDYVVFLNNLGALYLVMGNYYSAESLLLKAKEIRKEALGEKHPDYASSLNNLAIVYRKTGKYSKAEALLTEAENILKSKFGAKHPDYVNSLNNLALLYFDMGNYVAAETLFVKAKNILIELQGEKLPLYAKSTTNLAVSYQAKGENQKAELYYIENMDVCLSNIKQNFGFLSEKEKESYIKAMSNYINSFSSFAYSRFKENPLIANKLYDVTLATKGLLLNSSNRIRNEINSGSDTGLVNKYNKWQALKEDIGRYSQWTKDKLEKVNVNLDSLEILANTMEKEISLKSKAFSDDRKNNDITWDMVQKKLGDKDAAIEFISYNIKDPKKSKASDTLMYCALVLRKEDKYPQLLSLCTGNELSALTEQKEFVKTTAVDGYVADEAKSRQLYKMLWQPLDTLLAGKEKIYVSLSGLLNKISFNALQDDKKQLLLNKYNLCFVNSTRQLAAEDLVKKDTSKTIALFGGINYEPDTAQIKKGANNPLNIYASRALSSDTSRGSSWNYLAGTITEVNNINKMFSEKKWTTKVDTGSKATEESFKSLSRKNSPYIIHISTHGFFYPEPDSSTYKITRNPFRTMLNPLWRSGILFAGVNYTWQCNPPIEGREDGVLTAYEVANCNLRNTDLVVLSACKTGLGDIKTGEGVYGLQRAFQVAGAKAVIMSLWQVPDKETSELMLSFYENYIKTNNKHESLRKAQQEMAKSHEPYYWAGFVMVE